MNKIFFIAMCFFLVFAIYLVNPTLNPKDTSADTTSRVMQTYSGKIYIAGMGGHFAEVEVVIDPSKDSPIFIKELNRFDIGDKDTHPVHDVRIDADDRAKMYWSTYKLDKKAEGKTAHVGVIDLDSGKIMHDLKLQVPERALWTWALYCASGQTKKSYLPVTMTSEGYIDVFDKQNMDLKHRIFLDSLGYKSNYQFFHGTSSPDMKTFVFAINLTKDWLKPDTPAERLGKIDMLLLDLPALEKGEIKVIGKKTITGSPEKTITFRQSFTPDGKYLLQSGADRFFLMKGDDLQLLDEEMLTDGENHEALSTSDGKYAVLTIRSKIAVPEAPEGKKIMDGFLQLYDIEARKVVGKPVSVCYQCHKEAAEEGKDKKPLWDAILCGADVNWKL